MLTLALLAQLATAPPTLPPPCACASRVETDGGRVARLRGELRSAELAVVAARVNASNERKHGKGR